MFKKHYTGIDGEIKISLSSSFEVDNREHKNKIYVIPSDKMIYLTEKTELSNKKDILNAYKLKMEEKFPNSYFDIDIKQNTVHIIVIRDFQKPKDYYMLDGEIFSLHRFYKYFVGEDGFILNIKDDRTTAIQIKDGNIWFYRVIKSKDINTVLTQFEIDDKQKPILLAGNISKDIEEVLYEAGFRNLVFPQVCNPEEVVAYGAALKGVLNDKFLSFKSESVSEEDLKFFMVSFGIVAVIYGLVFVGLDFYQKKLIRDIKREQTQIFKKAFPDQPVVSAYEQMKAMVKVSPEFKLSQKLLNIDIPKNAKIYKIEYIDGVLSVKGESSEPPNVAKSIKKTPLGNFEFEVEIK